MFHRPVVHFSLRSGVAGVCSGVPLCELLCLVGLFFFVAGAIVFRLVTTIMPCRLVPCDLGDPGGDPWFPHGTLLLYSLAGMTLWSGFFCLVLLYCQPY